MSVKDIMHDATMINQDSSVLEVSRVMKDKDIGSVLIKVNPLDYGMVTERDIIIKVLARDLDPKSVKAGDVMSELRYTIDSNASIEKASEIFNLQHIRRLPVMENGEIVGLITTRDVARRWSFNYHSSSKKFEGTRSKRWR
ncbi:MAG: CBS domain-containing protein [Candidatus Hydrothermarchaeales archaeon]